MAKTVDRHKAMLIQIVLFVILVITINCTETVWNNQIQLSRKLSPLRSYKDVQVFRFQISPETWSAIFHFNASQSELATNQSTGWSHHTRSGTIRPSMPSSTYLSPPLHPMYGGPMSPSHPPTTTTITTTNNNQTTFIKQFPWFNTTLVTIYRDKMVRIYKSLLVSSCRKPLDVTVYLRWGSLPLLSIRNGSNPANFIYNETNEQYRIKLKTNGEVVQFQLNNPLPGDWYGVAYIDQVNDRIAQKGLERECYYRLKSTLDIETLNRTNGITILTSSSTAISPLKQSLNSDDDGGDKAELFFKFYPTTKELGVKIIIKNCQTDRSNVMNDPNGNGSCPITINYRALTLPNSNNRDMTFSCQANHSSSGSVELSSNGKCVIDLPTYAPDEWNYLQIVPLENSDNNGGGGFSGGFGRPINPFIPKPNYGKINFTIQLLMGQEAYLYTYFNEQDCSISGGGGGGGGNNMQQSGINSFMATSTHNPMLPYGPNFGLIGNERKVYSSVMTTAASVRVGPQEPNAISHKQTDLVRPLAMGDHQRMDEFDLNPHPIVVNDTQTKKVNQSHLHSTQNEQDSVDYVENDNENDDQVERELSKSSLAQFAKRSADPPQTNSGMRERKKGDRKKEENRRRKQKNRQGQQKHKVNKQINECQFDPLKIMATLDEEDRANMSTVMILDLNRIQGNDNFEFKYAHLNEWNRLPIELNQSEIVYVEVDNDRPSLANFSIIPQFDMGGSLMIDFAISPQTNNQQQNVSAIMCLSHRRLPPIVSALPGIRFDQYCYGHLVSNTSVANYSTDGSPIQSLVIPYPQAGTWYISIVVRCYTDEDGLEDPLLANVDYSGYSCDYSNKTDVLLEVRSSACDNGQCHNGGKCQQFLNGGILYSTCSCRAGWKGWACTDGSEALSDQRLLLNFLLLTISNAAFVPSIVVAACRRYFTESIVYFITATSSALYHACDSDYPQSYCVFSMGLLQFADFYTAILSFFVTLITLANLSPRFKSFLHLIGAIAIALITQNDRTSLWTFVVPAGLATLLLFTCWCSQCCRRSCYPPTKCWIFSVCPALILTVIGLIIYAFFETQDNYAITHSIWHGIVALALLFAIPSMPNNQMEENEEEDEERAHFMSSSSSSGAGSGKGTTITKTNPETYYELIGEEASHLARSHPPQGVSANSKHISHKTY